MSTEGPDRAPPPRTRSEATRSEAARSEAARRRRRAEVFGEVLPEATGDDSSPGDAGGVAGETAREEWLRRNVPPHHR